MTTLDPQRVEALGPAERIIQTLTTFTDHAMHGRPGIVIPDHRTNIGVRWEPVIWKYEGGQYVVYKTEKAGRKTNFVRVGVRHPTTNEVHDGHRTIGEYRTPGLYAEVVVHLYQKIADVWRIDNEFAARWASWAFPQEHRDLKVLLAAFMLVQNRIGAPVLEDGKRIFDDDDHRAVGEAMCLLRGKHDLNPKLLLRVGDILELPQVAAINRALGFGRSGRRPPLGRYPRAVTKWLRQREANPKMLEGLVKSGFTRTVWALASRVGYKPETPRFFEILRWRQKQARDGRRVVLNVNVAEAETWAGLSEVEICQRIIETRPNAKRIAGMLPRGWTRAIMAATIQAGSLSDSDLIIYTPTLEELALLDVPEVKARWEAATKNAENQRALNIAKRVRKASTVEVLQAAADTAAKKAVEEVTRDLRVYVIVDKSGSMQGAIETAKSYLAKFLQSFALDRLHVSVFNSVGTEITIKHASAQGVEQAFRGHNADGGTYYSEGVKVLAKYQPAANQDALMIFVGDQEGEGGLLLAEEVRRSGLRPIAFGLLEVRGTISHGLGSTVVDAARHLNTPVFRLEESMFNDPYAVSRILRNAIAAAPSAGAGQPEPRRSARKSLVEEILQTPLLQKPVWA